MGLYYYSLRTKSRRVVIDGGARDVFPVEFAYKHGQERRTHQMTQERQERVWAGRETPEYIVWGGFEDEAPVYRKWPENSVLVSEHITDYLELVGYLVRKGRRFEIQQWHTVRLGRELSLEERHEANAKLINIGIDPMAVRVYTPKKFSGNYGLGSETLAAFRHENDSVIGKVALI